MRIPFSKLGSIGVIKDQTGYRLPPEAWTDAYNIRFFEEKCLFFGGWEPIFGTPTVQPWYVDGILNGTSIFWIYLGIGKAYVYDGTVHTDITRTVGGDYTPGVPSAWNSTRFGGIPIFNNGVDLPQYWTGFSTANKLANLSNWPANLRAKVIRSFGRYGVALNLIEGAVSIPNAVQWSHPADPGTLPSSWDITDPAKDAGRRELTDDRGGSIMDGLPLGNQFIIYKKNSTHVMRYVGGTEIMGVDQLFSQTGLIAPRCVCATKKGDEHLVVTEDDVILHKGNRDIQSVVDKKNRKAFFNDLDSGNYQNMFVFDNSKWNEVWICYPSVGNTYPNKAMVINVKDGQCMFRDWVGHYATAAYIFPSSLTWDAATRTWDAATEVWEKRSTPAIVSAAGDPAVISDKNLFLFDLTSTGNGANRTAYLERVGAAFLMEKGEIYSNFDITKNYGVLWYRTNTEVPDKIYFQAVEESSVMKQLSLVGTEYPVDSGGSIDLIVTGTQCGYRFEFVNKINLEFDQIHLEIEKVGENNV